MGVPAPLEEPLSYPGERPRTPFLLRGDVVSPLPASYDVTGRAAVLAIGSNACPAQLAAKFRNQACSDVVPGLVVTVDALVVRPSAHFGRAGYWPFAPARLDASTTECVLTLLDADQVAVFDGSEPNYDRVGLDPAVHRVRLGQAAFEHAVEVYVSRHGVVDDDRLPLWTDPPPTQHALISALLRVAPGGVPARDVKALSQLVLRQPDTADETTRAIQRHLRVRPDGLATRQDERRSDRLATPSANER